MFHLEENPGLTDSGIYKKVQHWKIPKLSFILHESFRGYRVVIVHVEFTKIIEGKTGLQVQCLFEEIIGKIKRIPCCDLRHVQYILLLIDFLIKHGVV